MIVRSYLPLASKMALNQTHQRVALRIYSSHYELLTGKEKLLGAKAAAQRKRLSRQSGNCPKWSLFDSGHELGPHLSGEDVDRELLVIPLR